jgi:hypothetical protein
MDAWTSRSNTGSQTALSVACAAAGLALMIGFRDFGGLGSNAAAGFFLGVMLLLLGAAGFLASGTQTVVVDPGARRITIVDSGRFGTKRKVIPFSSITDVGIGSLGKTSSYVRWYYLVLTLRTGGEYPLFAPGRFYEGGSDRPTVAGWKQRLEEYLSR